MAHHNTISREHHDVLSQVREGMTVYDSDRNNIGSVDAVFFGAESDQELAAGTAPATATTHRDPSDNAFVESLAEVFDPRDQVPDELAERLHYSGYIRIDGGWFGSDRYIMPDQISSVSDESVYLRTKSDHLIKE